MHVLVTLGPGEKHGYAIMRDAEALSDGAVRMILLATIPAFAFFWVIVPAVAGLLIWIGVSAGFSDEPVPAPTT